MNNNQVNQQWYNDKATFWYGFVRSNYVTAITDWFMSFAGKWAELVLYGTVLYSCAELYPGVHLPTGLSIAVFLVQLGALDVGGLSLGKMAKQAKLDGNVTGADYANTLSKWLIGIMIVGVVTVGVERIFLLPDGVQITIQLALVVGRSICSVLYGRVVHSLKIDIAHTLVPVADVRTKITELTESFSEHLQNIEWKLAENVEQMNSSLVLLATKNEQRTQGTEQQMAALFEQVTQGFTEQFRQFSEHLLSLSEQVEMNTRKIQSVNNAKQPVKHREHVQSTTPAKNVIPFTNTPDLSKRERVHSFLKQHPDASISDIVNTCEVSRGYASGQRSLFQSEHLEDRQASL